MTEIAASDFRHPRRHVRLDTILRLRWLAVLGQLAAIFIVAQGLEFDVPVVPCVTIIGLSALLNLVLQIAFNPMQRLEPVYAAALLALNIVELAGLLFFTGGLQNPFSFLFLAPVLIAATALPIRFTIALGLLAVACASALVYFHFPLPWDSDDPLVLPPIYLFGVCRRCGTPSDTAQPGQNDLLGEEIRVSLRAVQESVDSFGRWLDEHQSTCLECRNDAVE